MNHTKQYNEDRRVTVYNAEAVILVTGHHIPSRELFSEWKKQDAKVILFVGGGLSAKGYTEQVRDFPEIAEFIDLQDQMKRNRISARLRETLKSGDLDPTRTLLVADHPEAVAAGKRKGLFTIVGICEKDHPRRPFYKNGAHLVVSDPGQLELKRDPGKKTVFSQEIPGLFENRQAFESEFKDREPVFFFDYDGTLASIVRNPDEAFMTDSMRKKLAGLASAYRVSVVSGRDKSDIEEFVQLERVIYAGSHGFRISGPDGLYMEQEKAGKLLPRLDEMTEDLRVTLEQKVDGVKVERKYFAIAIHYRNAGKGTFKKVNNEVNRLIGNDPDFKKGRGKKILEIKPSLNWHKGTALEWIMDHLDLSYPDSAMPVYVGDDVTDEDAFRTLSDNGVGILVGKHSQLSAAKYHLTNVEQVEEFIQFLLENKHI